MKELHCPTYLQPYADRIRNEIKVAYRSAFPPVETITLSPVQIADSLSIFAERISNDGLDQAIKSFAKSDFPKEKFVLCAVPRDEFRSKNAKTTGKFVVDGEYSLVLGYLREKQAEPLWIGIVSFFLGLEDDHRIAKETGFTEPFPLIVQIQGAADWSYDTEEKYEDAKRVLRKLKWERALVTMVLEWAEENGIPAVYLLPSSLNLYWGSDERNKNLHMRYDVTAKRLGFQLQENGLFRALIDVSSNGDSPQS